MARLVPHVLSIEVEDKFPKKEFQKEVEIAKY